jgi:hypothetical protein
MPPYVLLCPIQVNLSYFHHFRWFAFPGDGAPINKWKHWFSNDPIVNDLTVEMYPSTDEYNDEDLMAADIKMRDGSYAKFYSTSRPSIVKKHFEWMR